MAAVVVVVRAVIGVFVNSVQKPEEELQGVVLRVSPKLRAVLGHDALQGKDQKNSSSHGTQEPIVCKLELERHGGKKEKTGKDIFLIVTKCRLI